MKYAWETYRISHNIHPDTVIGEGTKIGVNVEIREGVIIGRDCYIDSGVIITGNTVIGHNCIVRNNVIIARGSRIGNNCFLAPRVMFNNLDLGDNDARSIGGAKIGNNVKIGTNCVLQHGITICDDVTIGAMAFVRGSITEPGKYIEEHHLIKLDKKWTSAG